MSKVTTPKTTDERSRARDVASLPIFVINRNCDAERLRRVDSQLADAGLEFERVEAVEGLNVPSSLRHQFLDDSGQTYGRLLPGEVGCYASHLVCCQKIIDRGLDFAIVLEDDVDLPLTFRDIIQSTLQAAQTFSWDIIRLSSMPRGAVVTLSKLSSHYRLVQYGRLPKLTGAQIWTRAGAEKFLKQRRRVRPVDADLRYGWESHLVTLGVFPPLAVQKGEINSTIDGNASRKVLRGGRWRAITAKSRLAGVAHNIRRLGLLMATRCWLINATNSMFGNQVIVLNDDRSHRP